MRFGRKKCMSHCLLVFTYLCFIVCLGHIGDQNRFWRWKGFCVVCKNPKKGMKGLFCANFCFSLGDYPPCKMVWCNNCYRKGELDKFHVNKLKDEDGDDVYANKEDEDRYQFGVEGAQFVTPFKCDLCIFRILFNRDPHRTDRQF